ncbi:MAG: dienelactone hydrolase family protein [Parachlamydiaceae bacterium]|nr:MAG: dienelactone hydrolase family protein [Parachlamydiaceae bacterium]
MYTTKMTYKDEGQELEAFIAAPDPKEKRPLVLLCHAWSGRDSFICNKAELIASWGYVGFAIDMYGKGVFGKNKEENAYLKKPFIDNRLRLKNRVLKGFETACALPYVDTNRILALGFGFGAICALDLARSGANLNGVISVYGHFDSPKNVPTFPIKAKILILHGNNDPIAPMQELEIFQQQMDEEQVDWQTHIYSGTSHAFANPHANDPSNGILYHPLAAQRAWVEIEHFAKEVLGI